MRKTQRRPRDSKQKLVNAIWCKKIHTTVFRKTSKRRLGQPDAVQEWKTNGKLYQATSMKLSSRFCAIRKIGIGLLYSRMCNISATTPVWVLSKSNLFLPAAAKNAEKNFRKKNARKQKTLRAY